MIRRTIFPGLEKHLENPEISLIVGPRQAGKTTLMRQLQAELAKKGEKTVFLDMDNDSDRPFFSSQEALIHKIELEIGKDRGYVFLDEIQRQTNAGLFLKGVFDRNLPYKLIVSGSGSVELKEKIHESLAGRKRIFELLTLSFAEFADYRLENKYDNQLTNFFNLHPLKASQLLDEYLTFGGYPKIVLAQNSQEKMMEIQEIYKSYLEKDVAILLNIQKTEALTNLVRVLASQVGNPVNVSELSSTLGIAARTIENYLWYLEKTYIIKRVTPFFRNIRKEITKMPEIYFLDMGLRNYSLGQFGLPVSYQNGFLFQNFVFRLLKEKFDSLPNAIHFWRTQDKAEVDFIIEDGQEIIPVEAKFSRLAKPEITRSFRSFLHKYHPAKAYVIHLGESFKVTIGETQVHFSPYYEHT